MNIQINEDYKLVSDKYNVILQEKYEKEDKQRNKTGQFDYKDVGYYPSVEQALKGFVRKATLNSKASNLKELTEEIRVLHDTIKEATIS
ncbi:hypothetical protein [Bacillus paranthracis]|uniref:hypothetical protein n=1 Tax=Bacillus paranthracis TaxID=2026186 RepID=UPI0013CF76B2|nr:hypothetical protein [Bacillus paranthracis]